MDSKLMITLIMCVVTVVMYCIPRMPIIVPPLFGVIVLLFTGVITPSQAWAGMSSNAIICCVGMGMFSAAFFHVGLGDYVANKMVTMAKGNEKVFILLVFVVIAIFSSLVSGQILMLLLIPLVDSLAAKSNGAFTRKGTYIVMATAALVGGNLSIMGATSILNASSMYATAIGSEQGFSFFTPTILGLPAVVVSFLWYLLFGIKYQKKIFNFEERLPESIIETNDAPQKLTRPMWIVLIILAFGVYGFVFTDLNLGLVAMTVGFVCIATGVCPVKKALSGITWDLLFIITCMVGFAKGVEVSGAGQLLADQVMKIGESVGLSSYGYCVAWLLITVFISNFMSNNAAVGICAPIALSVAAAVGADPLPFALSVGVGANLAIATPMCATSMTMTLDAGYRFKDYVKANLPITVLICIVSAIMLKIVYF